MAKRYRSCKNLARELDSFDSRCTYILVPLASPKNGAAQGFQTFDLT
jgi:hypothetical protein